MFGVNEQQGAGQCSGKLAIVVPVPSYINSLVFFGFYCLLIGYLIFRSAFLPRILSALMAFAGFGWLTFLSPALAHHLSPTFLPPAFSGKAC